MLKTEFDPMEDMQTLTSHSNLFVVRTAKLLPTLQFMQENWRKLWELIPDDENGVEYNILTYYKPKKVLHSTKYNNDRHKTTFS